MRKIFGLRRVIIAVCCIGIFTFVSSNMSVAKAEGTTYKIESEIGSLANQTYYRYFPTTGAGTQSALMTRPYTIQAQYVLYMDSINEYHGYHVVHVGSDPNYLTILHCDSSGNTYGDPITLTGKVETMLSGFINISPNEGIRCEYNTGYYNIVILNAGTIIGQQTGACNGYAQITYQLDETAPNTPIIQLVNVTDNAQIKTINGIYYSGMNPTVIQWSDPGDPGTITSGVTKYKIYDNGDYVTEIAADSNLSTYSYSIITKDIHKIQVQALDYENNASSYSEPITVVIDRSVTQPCISTSPVQITVDSQNQYYVTFNWNAVTDVTGVSYQVALSQSDTEPANYEITDVTSNQYTFSNRDYSPNMYYAYVRAIDGLGNTSPWVRSAGFVLASPPSNITTITSHSELRNNNPYYHVVLALENVNAVSYVIQRQLEGETVRTTLAELTQAQLAAIGFKYTDEANLVKHGKYTYYVYTKNSLGVKSGEQNKTVIIPNIGAATVSMVNDNGQSVPSRLIINHNSYTFSITPTQDSEDDQLKFRVKYQTSDGLKTFYSSDSLQTGPVTVNLAEGSWVCQLEVGEFHNGVELSDAGYSRQTTASSTIIVDLTPPPATSNSFLIKSATATQIYDTQNNPTNTHNVMISNIALSDNPGGSGVQGIYLWNGSSTNRTTDAIYKSVNETSANIAWTLSADDGIKTVTMQVLDNAGNTSLVTYQVNLDTTPPVAPSSATFTHISTESLIHFEWQANNSREDVIVFNGQFVLPNGITQDFSVAATTSNSMASGTLDVNVTGCDPNRPVTLKVSAIDRAGNSSVTTAYITYTKAALGTLQNVGSGYDSGLNQHFLKWQLNQNTGQATGCLLEYGRLTTNGFTVLGTIQPDNNGYFTHLGLTPHGIYQYRLVALNNSGDRTEGVVFERQAPNTAPGVPQLLSPLKYARSDAEFKYSPVTDVDGDVVSYHVYLQNPDGSVTEINSSTVSGLLEGKTYAWYVVVDDGYATGKTQSAVGKFTIDNIAPNLTVETVRRTYTNQNQLTVIANDIQSGITKVNYQKIAAGTGEVLDSGVVNLANDSNGSLTGQVQLEEGNYHLHLTAWDNAGNSTLVQVNNLKVDLTQPQLSQMTLDLAQDNGNYLTTGKLPVQLTAIDNLSGINNLRYWILENTTSQLGTGQTIPLSPNLQRYAQTLNINGVNGRYYLVLAVEDAAGNRSEAKCYGPIILDLTAPKVDFALEGLKNFGSGYYLSDINQITINCKAADAETGLSATRFAIMSAVTGEIIAGWNSWDIVTQTPLIAGSSYYVAVSVVNKAGLEAEARSNPFIYDNSAPRDLQINGPNETGLAPGEEVVFRIAATESESVITQYRFALRDGSGNLEMSSQITGNTNGWLVKNSSNSEVQFRFKLPTESANGNYYPVVRVINAAGLVSEYTGNPVIVDNTQEKLTVGDQGPYTLLSDQLSGWWQYLGNRIVTGYQYRIIDQDNQSILDWLPTTEREIVVSGLKLTSGKRYLFQVKANFTDGSTLMGSSPGVILDSTVPQNVSLVTSEYSTSANLSFQWQATDDESGIGQAWVAIGNDYYQTDVSGGWIEIHGKSVHLAEDVKGQLLKLITGNHYYLTLRVSNGAGLITEKATPGIIIDDTAPPAPVVLDQGAYINPARQPLEANWIWTGVDPESGPVSYQWAVIPYGTNVDNVTWIDAGQSTKISKGFSDLLDGQTYYFAVKSFNKVGLSSIGYSNGIVMDQTAPVIPKVNLLQAINLGNKQEAVYITTADNLELSIETYDLSGISSYQYTYDSRTEVEENSDYNTSTSAQFVVNPTLNDGEITVFKSVCSDGAVNLSQAGYSSGVVLDTGAPQIKNVHGAVSGDHLLFDWDVITSTSPVIFYEYALVPDEQMNSVPTAWIRLGLERSLTINGQHLADGKYRLLIRGCNAAGTYSRREGEVNEWGISPRMTLDRKPPVLDKSKFIYPDYAADQMTIELTAEDDLSGIGGYQYAIGTLANPLQYSNGWVDVAGETGTLQFKVPTGQIPHQSEAYLLVRAKDKVGLWSEALVSQKIVMDHTLPTLPEVTGGRYIVSKNQVSGMSYISDDPESRITHCRLGIVRQSGEAWIAVQETPVADFNGTLINLSLEEGEVYYIGVQTRNGAGEWSKIGYSQAMMVDTIAPVLSFTKADSAIVLNTPPINIEYTLTEEANLQFVLTAADGTTQQYTITGQAGLNYFTFTASKPQTYQLTVIPIDSAGNIGLFKAQSIRVNTPPQVTLPAVFNTTPGASLKLTAVVVDPDGIPVTYLWNPGDGGSILSGVDPQHIYLKAGTYPVTLTVMDNDGGETTVSTTVRVDNTTKGSLSVDETWSGTHHLCGNVTVPAGVHLTILSGTEIVVEEGADTDSGYALNIQGSISIQAVDPKVTFRSVLGQANGWQGIIIEGSATFDGITVQDAVRGITVLNSANVTLSNSIFQNNEVGLHVYSTQFTVNGCSFLNNSFYGIKEDEGGRPVVVDCLFSGNGMDYYHETLTDISIEELNQLDGNSGNR